MSKECKPSRYAVISGRNITYGFRCPKHHILTRRYSTKELREQRLREHQKEAKKS
jgi:hypothetical protein